MFENTRKEVVQKPKNEVMPYVYKRQINGQQWPKLEQFEQ